MVIGFSMNIESLILSLSLLFSSPLPTSRCYERMEARGEEESPHQKASAAWVLVISAIVRASVVPLMHGQRFCFFTVMHVKELQLADYKNSPGVRKNTLVWGGPFCSLKLLPASFQRTWVPWLVALGNTPEAPSQTVPLTTVNLKGSEALDSPVGGSHDKHNSPRFCSAHTQQVRLKSKGNIDPFRSYSKWKKEQQTDPTSLYYMHNKFKYQNPNIFFFFLMLPQKYSLRKKLHRDANQ